MPRPWLGFASACALGWACSAASPAQDAEPGGQAGAGAASGGVAGGGATAGSSGSSGRGGSAGALVVDAGGAGGYGAAGPRLDREPPCHVTGHVDTDGDGFYADEGDCNDCTAQINPGALDWPGNGVDEDCSGAADDEPETCDTITLPIGVTDSSVALRAMGLCKRQSGKSWGVIRSAFTLADGSGESVPLQRGILSSFGRVTPREGRNLFMLSTGSARRPGDPGYSSPKDTDTGTKGVTPPGYPIDSPSCSVVTRDDRVAWNPSALEVTLRTPSNANLLRFRFNFYTYEYPRFVCSENNDFFVALLSPAPEQALEGNVSFDGQGNPISVNSSFLEVCTPGTHYGKEFLCASGTGDLQGTGFEPGAATGWLTTSAPVPPGTDITLRLALWDMGDAFYDSSVLLDALGFDIGQSDTVTVPE